MPKKKVAEELGISNNSDTIMSDSNVVLNQEKIHESPNEKPASFYELDFKELDKNLSPDQLREWTDIYASYRSKSALSGTVIGVDTYRLKVMDAETKESVFKQVQCLVLMDFRVKVIIPQTEIWHEKGEQFPDYAVRNMVGTEVDYVITNVDREGECALASRKMAIGFKKNRFLTDRRGHKEGEIVDCTLLVVGPKRAIVECNGFDLTLSQRDISYTAIEDLRQEFKTGQKLSAKLKKFDTVNGNISISIKEVNPNPFDGADARHPAGCTRQATISGSYGGGLFCRLADDTNCLCLYSPGYFSEKFNIGDKALIRITRYDYAKKLIYGKILSKQ